MPHPASLWLALSIGWLADEPPRPVAPIDVASALESTLADAIGRAEPSVVAIARDKDGKGEQTTAIKGRTRAKGPADEADFNNFRVIGNGGMLITDEPEYVSSDYGSGVVIGDQGQILTSFGVVRGASRLLVRAPGTPEFEAEVLAADPRSDLAVIVPRDEPGVRRPSLRALPMGDSSKLRKGHFLLALGNPFNAGRDGRASASWGILANVARRLDASQFSFDLQKRQLRHYPTLLQLDSKLNLGMSGGAVINLKGELVGLTIDAANAGGFDAQAGYAMPIDVLSKRAIAALVQGQEVEYGFLGIGLDKDGTNRIANVQPGTPAGEGDLRLDDVVLSIGGLPVTDADSLVVAVNSFVPGDPIHLKIVRNGEELDKTVVLSKLRVEGEVIATQRPNSWRGLRVDFVSTSGRAVQGNDVLNAMARGGVLIVEVAAGSAAEDADLKPGQIVTAVDGKPVRNPTDFRNAVRDRSGPVDLVTETGQVVTVK